MKWIGQHIYDLVSKFRDDVYLEDLSTTTETNILVVDSDGKVSKNTTGVVGTTVRVTDNESTAENNLLTFVAGAATTTGDYGLEMDGNCFYTPSTGKITATGFIGALTGQADTVATIAGLAPNTATTQAVQPNITTLAGVTSIGTASSSNVTVVSDLFKMTNAGVTKPELQMISNSSSAYGPVISMSVIKGAAGSDNDELGNIRFNGYNDAGTPEYTH